jgi:hypothetical protein
MSPRAGTSASSATGRVALKHLIARVKVLACVSHQLAVAGMVYGFDADHLGHNFKASSEAKGSVSQSENPYLIHKLT